MPTDLRPSVIDGLVITGNPRLNYRLACPAATDDRMLLVHDGRENSFRTVREANAAATRIATVMPWADTAVRDKAARSDTGTLRHDIRLGLLNKTDTQIAAEAARSRAWHDGTGPRDQFDSVLTAEGHRVQWNRHGAKSYWGTCQTCGDQFRSSYQSISRSYARIRPHGTQDCNPNR